MKGKRTDMETVERVTGMSKGGASIGAISCDTGLAKSTVHKIILANTGPSDYGSWIDDFRNYKSESGRSAYLLLRYDRLDSRMRYRVRKTCPEFASANLRHINESLKKTRRRLGDDIRDKAKDMFASGKNAVEISKELKVSATSINLIKKELGLVRSIGKRLSDSWIDDFANYRHGDARNEELIEKYNGLGIKRKQRVISECPEFIAGSNILISSKNSARKKLGDDVVRRIKDLHQSGKSINYIASKLGVSRGTASKYLELKKSENKGWIDDFENYPVGSGENKELARIYFSLEKWKRSTIRNKCDVFFLENEDIIRACGSKTDKMKLSTPERVIRCDKCGESDPKNFYKEQISMCRKCRNSENASYRKKVTDTVKTEMGGKCARCGYDEFLCGLDFHHLRDKDREYRNFSLQQMREEAGKCLLLCAPCHRALHAGLWDISSIGTIPNEPHGMNS